VQYRYPDNTGFHSDTAASRLQRLGVSDTPDAHLVALDARNGTVRWNVEIADAKKALVDERAVLVRNHLLVGVAGDFDNLPGMLTSIDPETGKTSGFLQHASFGHAGRDERGRHGGQMWMTGTYDPQVDLVYVGTGNPTPVLNGDARPGDQSLDVQHRRDSSRNGKARWGFQATPHDTHDGMRPKYRVLVTAHSTGVPRKMHDAGSLARYFYSCLDRAQRGPNCDRFRSPPLRLATGLARRAGRFRSPEGAGARWTARAPNEGGGTNYRSPSFDPAAASSS